MNREENGWSAGWEIGGRERQVVKGELEMGEEMREEHAAHLTPFIFARKITPALEKFFTTEPMESMG